MKENYKKISFYEKVLIISMFVGSGLSYQKLYLYHILLVFNLIFAYFYVLKYKKIKIGMKQDKAIYIFFLYSLFHMFLVKDLLLSMRNQIYIFLGISVFITTRLLMKKNDKEVLNTIRNIVGVSFFIAILEIGHLYRWYTSSYNISYSFPTTFYGNTNDYATIIIGIIPFVFFLKGYFKKVISLGILIFILIKCESRTNEIALVSEVGVYLFLQRNKIAKRLKIGIFTLSLGILVYFREKIYSLFTIFIDLYNSSGNVADSIGIRKTLLLNLFEELKKVHIFIFGTGGGNSILIHQLKGNTSGILSNHSFFLEILVEYGVFIFIMLSFYYVMLIIKNYKFSKKTETTTHSTLVISLIGVAIGLNSMSGVIYFFPFWMLLAIASFFSQGEKETYR